MEREDDLFDDNEVDWNNVPIGEAHLYIPAELFLDLEVPFEEIEHLAENMAQNPVQLTPDQFRDLLQNIGGNGGGGAKLPTFEGGSASEWRRWRAIFENHAQMRQWGNQRARREAFGCLRNEAISAVNDIAVDAAGATLQELLDQYATRFIPAAAGELARSEFASAAQRPDESILAWHTRARELFLRAYPNRANEVENAQDLIDKFVHNIYADDIRVFILEQGADTYLNALNRAQRKQAANNINRGAKKGRIQQIDGMADDSEEEEEEEGGITHGHHEDDYEGAGLLAAIADRPQPHPQCWYCQKKGHMRNDCHRYRNDRTWWIRHFALKVDADGNVIGVGKRPFRNGPPRFFQRKDNQNRGGQANRGGRGPAQKKGN